MNIKKKEEFRKKVWEFYKKNRREFPWRETFDPYKILISEVMLQQTQTSRVTAKYEEFLKKFKNFEDLAKATTEEVLRAWSGLGYNRRALYLKKIAELVSKEKSEFPLDPKVLVSFPGIGPNTAGSIYVFTTNKPYVFIETNIRRVFIHEFFKDSSKISDKQLLELVNKTLDTKNPREWYYALMDYGAYLAKTEINPNRKSKHYSKQSKFEGSLRQVRGKILKILLEKKMVVIKELEKQFENEEHFQEAMKQLQKEGFTKITKGVLVIEPSSVRP